MRRRDFITFIVGALTTWPLAARAQQQAMPVIGLLGSATASDWVVNVKAFRQGLRDAGYLEGSNVSIDARWANSQYERLPAMVAELIQRKVTVIAAFSTPAARAAKAATTTIPIVFTTIADPVQIGFVASLNRPGGNATGVTLLAVQVEPKMLGLLHEAVPSATIMALLVNPTNPNAETQSRNFQAAALKLGLHVDVVNASTERDFDAVFAKLHELRADALMIAPDVLFTSQSDQLAALTVRHAMPAIYQFREFASAGGLMSYGASLSDEYRQAGIYVGRILKGEKLADLPVMQSTKFELTINLKTAKAFGLTLSSGLLSIADEVIE